MWGKNINFIIYLIIYWSVENSNLWIASIAIALGVDFIIYDLLVVLLAEKLKWTSVLKVSQYSGMVFESKNEKIVFSK